MEGESASTELPQAASQTDTNNNQVWVFVLFIILKVLHQIQHCWQNVLGCYQDLAGGIFVAVSGATTERGVQKAQ